MKLTGNTVLIIGGSAGIGKEIAIAFHELQRRIVQYQKLYKRYPYH